MANNTTPASQEALEKLEKLQKGGSPEEMGALIEELEKHHFFTNENLETVEAQIAVREKIDDLLLHPKIIFNETVKNRLEKLHEKLKKSIEAKETPAQSPQDALKDLVEKSTPENRTLYADATALLGKGANVKDIELFNKIKRSMEGLGSVADQLKDKKLIEQALANFFKTSLAPLKDQIKAELTHVADTNASAATPEAPKVSVATDELSYEEKRETLLGLASMSKEFADLEKGLEELYSILDIKKKEVESDKKLAIHLTKVQDFCRKFLDGINAKKLSEMSSAEELKKEMTEILSKFKEIRPWIEGFRMKKPTVSPQPQQPSAPSPAPSGAPGPETPQPAPNANQPTGTPPVQPTPTEPTALVESQNQDIEAMEEEAEEGLGKLPLANAVTEACLAVKSQFKIKDPACRALERLLREDSNLNMEDLIKYLKNPTLHNKNVATKERVEALRAEHGKVSTIDGLIKRLGEEIKDKQKEINRLEQLAFSTAGKTSQAERKDAQTEIAKKESELKILENKLDSVNGYQKMRGGIETYKSPKELLGQVLQYLNRENDQFNPMEAAMQLDQRIENEMGIESYEGARKYIERALLVLRPTLGATLKALAKDSTLKGVDDTDAAEKLGELASCEKEEDVVHWLEGLKKWPDVNPTVSRLIAFLELGIREGISSNVLMDGAAKTKKLVRHLRTFQRGRVLEQVDKDLAGKPNLEKFKEYCKKLNELENQNNHVSSNVFSDAVWKSRFLKAGSAVVVPALPFTFGFAMLPTMLAVPALLASLIKNTAISEKNRNYYVRGIGALAIGNALAVAVTPWTLFATIPIGALSALKPEWAKKLGNAMLWPISKLRKNDKKALPPTNP